MPQYVVEIPIQFTVEGHSATSAYATAMARADALVCDGASYTHIKETDRAYWPSRIQETLTSRRKRANPKGNTDE